jgi:glycolate oxidase FAD binding subunit
MKLFTGSFGTLGIIVEATFKLRPLPAQEMVCVLPVEQAADLPSAALAPQYVEAVNRAGATCVGLDDYAIVVGCGGTAEEIAAQRERLANRFGHVGLRVCGEADGARLYEAVRDFPAADANGGEGTCGCKVSMLPSQLASLLTRVEEEAARRTVEPMILSHVGSGIALIRFNASAGDQLPSFAEWLRATVRAAGGWVVFDLLPTRLKDRIDPWGAEPPGLHLMRGIKRTLDPNGCMSPGRFVGGI